MPSADAVRRSLAIELSRAGGSVRRMPTPAFSIRAAAAMPVASDSWAFQSSTGSGAR